MLHIKELSVSYGDLPALKNVTIQVKKGTITSILGAIGAGKTTLLKTISGLNKNVKGDVLFQDVSLVGKKPHEIARMKIAHVPENRRVFSNLTILENLEVGSFEAEAKKKRQESLEYVFSIFPKLYERKKQKAGTLSGGEQQMLAIGRALMLRPSLLMLDEPSLGLAPLIVEEVFKHIQKIYEEGVTVLLVEQNAHASLDITQYGFVLENGSLTIEGDRETLLNSNFIKKAYLGLEVV
jgi:branched-chain amino acid transport system ATP-binding protein